MDEEIFQTENWRWLLCHSFRYCTGFANNKIIGDKEIFLDGKWNINSNRVVHLIVINSGIVQGVGKKGKSIVD